MMSVWRDMAHDGGYRGDEAEQVARMLEEGERAKQEMYAEMEARYLADMEAEYLAKHESPSTGEA